MSEVVLRFDFIVKMLLMYRVFSFLFSVCLCFSFSWSPFTVCLPACLSACVLTHAPVDFDCLDAITLAELKGLAPTYEHHYHASGAKVHLLQSIVSRILVEMVFDTYFPGLSDEQVRRFHQMEETLSQLG